MMMNPFTWLVTTLVGGPVGANALPVVPVHVAVVAWPRGRSIRTGTARSVRRMIGLVAIFTSRSSLGQNLALWILAQNRKPVSWAHLFSRFVGDGFCFLDTTVQIEPSPAFEDE